MHFRKRPTVYAVLLLSLCFLGFGHRTLAMDFTERNGNLVTQNGESIRVARTHAGKVAVQLQHVPSSNRWYLRLQDLKRAADSQFGPITLVNGSRTLTLQPQSDATGRTYPAGVPGLDRWYLLTPDEAAQLSVPHLSGPGRNLFPRKAHTCYKSNRSANSTRPAISCRMR